MEARGFNPAPVGPLPRHQAFSALISPCTGWARLQTRHVSSQAIVGVLHRLNIRLCQKHHVETPAFNRPYGLRQSKSPAIPYV